MSTDSAAEGTGWEWLSARELYASELAHRRQQSGMTLVQLAELCHYEQSYLHRLERGTRLGTLETASALDRVYGTGELLAKLWHLAKRESRDRPFLGLASLEAGAAGIQEYAVSAVPELLQVRAYAEEQLRACRPGSGQKLDAQVAARLKRQERLTGQDPVHYRALIDEAVLRREARDPQTGAPSPTPGAVAAAACSETPRTWSRSDSPMTSCGTPRSPRRSRWPSSVACSTGTAPTGVGREGPGQAGVPGVARAVKVGRGRGSSAGVRAPAWRPRRRWAARARAVAGSSRTAGAGAAAREA